MPAKTTYQFSLRFSCAFSLCSLLTSLDCLRYTITFSGLDNATAIFLSLPRLALFFPAMFQSPLHFQYCASHFLFSHFLYPRFPLPMNFPQTGQRFGFPLPLLDFLTFATLRFVVLVFFTLAFAIYHHSCAPLLCVALSLYWSP